MSDNTTDWTELREFQAIDLAASFVLSWHLEGDALLLDVDVCLTEEHAFYDKPRRSGDRCIHPAVLEFPHCTCLRTREAEARDGAIGGLASRIGLGGIRGLQRTGDGVYRLRGQFGKVTIHAERPLLRLKNLSS